MGRWIALAFTLICLGTCSLRSTDPIRGVYAPIGVLLGLLASTILFVSARVQGAARAPTALTLDPEVQALLRKRAAAKKVEELKAKLAVQQNQRKPDAGDST